MTIESDSTVIATGRRGAEWLEKICAEYDIAHQPGTVDIGVRVEVRNEIIERSMRFSTNQSLSAIPDPLKIR